jgi:Icc-related predicted phosphoesterase
MIKFAYASDFHFERYPIDSVINFITNWEFEPLTNGIILAGDITTGVHNVMRILEIIWDVHHIPIYYVPGNHEYYGSSLAEFDAELHRLDQNENINILNRKCLFVHGVMIAGAQCISDMSYPDSGLFVLKNNYADFSYITDFDDTYTIYGKEDRQFIERVCKITNDTKIIISHNPPHPICVSSSYINNPNNCMFVNDYSDILDNYSPNIWICGHTHAKMNKETYNTKIYTNPYGYEFEPISRKWKWEYIYNG